MRSSLRRGRNSRPRIFKREKLSSEKPHSPMFPCSGRWSKRSRQNPNRNAQRRIFPRFARRTFWGRGIAPPARNGHPVGPLRGNLRLRRRDRQADAHRGLTPSAGTHSFECTRRADSSDGEEAGGVALELGFLIDIAGFLICVRGDFWSLRDRTLVAWSGAAAGAHFTESARLATVCAVLAGRISAAYALSLVFALGYGYVAASSRRAEIVMVPLLDILQSIPVLSFLPE